MNRFYIAISFLLLVSCHPKPKQQKQESTPAKKSSLQVKYAKGFAVDYYDGFKLVTVKDWKNPAKQIFQYALIEEGKATPEGIGETIKLNGAIHKVICISTNHISALDRLGLVDSIAAVANVALIYNGEVQKRIQSESIADVGTDELNYERIKTLDPSFVFTSGNWDGGDKMMQKLNTLKIKAVLDLDYMEQEPLARAEWIKFVAAFYNKEMLADSIFNEIENTYLVLKEKVRTVSLKPTVFANMPFKEIWYMPCGDNYVAKIIADAGGDFLWKDSKATNSLNLNLDYEAVYAKAANADFWLCNSFASSLQEIKAADNKNSFFKAFKTGKVYNNNKRNTPSGGFDFWESGALNPDKVLADLISIFHPALLPNHELYYYQRLK